MKKLLLLIPFLCFAQKDFPGSSLKNTFNSLNDKNINKWSVGCDEENPYILCFPFEGRVAITLNVHLTKLPDDNSIAQVIMDGVVLTKLPTVTFTDGQIVTYPSLSDNQYVITLQTLTYNPKPNEHPMTGIKYNTVLHINFKPAQKLELLKILLNGYKQYVPSHKTNK